MGEIPQVSGKQTGRVLTRLGFELKSQHGSHMKFVRKTDLGTETVVVPNHQVLRKGTLHSILKYLKLDLKRFKDLL